MVFESPKDILVEIKHIMLLNDVSMKELAIKMKKSQQSISQIFSVSNPKLSTLFEICEALNLEIEISFITGDTK